MKIQRQTGRATSLECRGLKEMACKAGRRGRGSRGRALTTAPMSAFLPAQRQPWKRHRGPVVKVGLETPGDQSCWPGAAARSCLPSCLRGESPSCVLYCLASKWADFNPSSFLVVAEPSGTVVSTAWNYVSDTIPDLSLQYHLILLSSDTQTSFHFSTRGTSVLIFEETAT